MDPDNKHFSGGVEARTSHIYRHLRSRHRLSNLSRSKSFIIASTLSVIPRLLFIITSIIRSFSLPPQDLVEGSNFICYLPAFVIARLKRAASVAWFADVYQHIWFQHYSFPTAVLGYLLETISLRLPWTQVIAMSQATQAKLIQTGVDPAKITVIYGGVDLDYIHSLSSSKYTTPTAITMSRLVNYKRIQDVIRAVALVHQKGHQLHLKILDTGPELKNLQQLVSQLGLTCQVSFLGPKSHHQALRLLRRCHLFSLPSLVEGFGLVTVEAMASGIPYVNSDIVPTREITHGGQGGLLVPPKSPQAIAQAISQLLTHPQLYRQKSAQGKRLSRRYNWTTIAKQTLAVYKRSVTKYQHTS